METEYPPSGLGYDPAAQVHLGLFHTGVGPQLLWSAPDSAPHHHRDTFLSVARTLERGLFDAYFLGEGLRVREKRGRVLETDVAGRPDAITLLSALAGATDRIGLVATQNTTYNQPADLSRRLASLHLLSGGRAGWNIVTTDNAWTGENFRHGGWLAHEDRYDRAEQFVRAARDLWSAWPEDAVADDGKAPSWARPGAIGTVRADTPLVRMAAAPTLPTGPDAPVLFQAGDSPGGRDLAARHADVVFTSNTTYDKALSYTRDLTARLAAYGRDRESLRVMPGAVVVIGDTAAEARERYEWMRAEEYNGPRCLAFLEQWWGRDLSGYDPDGPLPDVEPVEQELDPSRGTIAVAHRTGKLRTIALWRRMAEERGLSIRRLVREVGPGHDIFCGTPGEIAETWGHYVRERVVDGFNITPQVIPGTVDDLVDRLVPALQERGLYRTAYEGTTLREHLGLARRED
ncbi:NtaA/DmoA family FMN-dependent monooxygenase [Streptomyces sp. NPDC002308]